MGNTYRAGLGYVVGLPLTNLLSLRYCLLAEMVDLSVISNNYIIIIIILLDLSISAAVRKKVIAVHVFVKWEDCICELGKPIVSTPLR